MLKLIGAVIGIIVFAWSWSKMPQIMDEWKDKTEN